MEEPRPKRDPYEPPAIQRIRMAQDEMAVAGCKTVASATGPTTGCYKAMCRSTGS